MVIDLPFSSQTHLRGNHNPVTQLANQRQDALQAALKAVNIKAGETVEAVVKSITQVDNSLRTRLIQLANPATQGPPAGANQSSTAPAGQPPITEQILNQAQSKLLNGANLKLLELNIKGQSVLVFSNQPVRAAQVLKVQLHQGSLIVVNPKTSNSPSYTANLQNAAISAPQTSSTTRPPFSQAQMASLTQALRTQLPLHTQSQHTQPPQLAETLLAAQLIGSLINQPEHQHLKLQLPRTLQQSLQQLAAHLRTPQQLSLPKPLGLAMRNNGLLLESRLAQFTQQNPALKASGAPLTPSPGNDLKAALLHTLNQLKQQPTAQAALRPGEKGQPSTPLLTNTAQLSPSDPRQILNPGAISLVALLRQLASNTGKTQARLPDSLLPQLSAQLQQHIQESLGRLQLRQLQSINQSLPNAEGLSTQHMSLEIPIRYGHEVQQLLLQLDEEWVNDYSDNPQEAPEKVRQWLVKLTFELPNAGSLHAHLSVVDDTISASFWASDPVTFELTQNALTPLKQRLEKDGCHVKKIECFNGKPAEDSIKLNYALVDIKT